jgi:hypothetical protein
MRRTIPIMLVAALLLSLAGPVSAGPAERVEEPYFLLIPGDEANELVTFVNATRAELCAWGAGGFDGPPPTLEPVTILVKETGKGAIVESFQADLPFEVWSMPGFTLDDNICEDHEGRYLASSVGRVSWNDNDVLISGTRTNSFGVRFHGAFTDPDGVSWRYSFRARWQFTPEGEFLTPARGFTLARTGAPS